MIKREGDKEIPEPFAEMARFFTESRLLQRDIKLLLEGVSNQIVLATVIHPVSMWEGRGKGKEEEGKGRWEMEGGGNRDDVRMEEREGERRGGGGDDSNQLVLAGHAFCEC